jgi:hypothetical protein
VSRWLYALVLCLLTCLSVQADDVVAKQLFDQGVAASAERRWQDAAVLFGESLRERDRPSYWELKEPLEVVRHALAFLSGPERQSQRAARVRAAQLLEQASTQLVVLDVSGLPATAQLKVDGEEPPRAQTRVYAEPGAHRLEANLAPDTSEELTVTLALGAAQPWPRAERRNVPAPAADLQMAQRVTTPIGEVARAKPAEPAREAASLRPTTAAILGGLGTAVALSAAGCLWVAYGRADHIAQRGADGTQDPSYLRAVDRYVRVTNTIVPLALVAGALATTATLLGERLLRRGTLGWSLANVAVGAALLGLGGFWAIHTPREVLSGTDMQRPSRQAGALMLSASLPFLTYGVAAPLARWRAGLPVLAAFAPAGARW